MSLDPLHSRNLTLLLFPSFIRVGVTGSTVRFKKFYFYDSLSLLSRCRCRCHWLHCWFRCIRLAKGEGGEEYWQMGREIKEIQLTISEKYIWQDLRNALLEYAFESLGNRVVPSCQLTFAPRSPCLLTPCQNDMFFSRVENAPCL